MGDCQNAREQEVEVGRTSKVFVVVLALGVGVVPVDSGVSAFGPSEVSAVDDRPISALASSSALATGVTELLEPGDTVNSVDLAVNVSGDGYVLFSASIAGVFGSYRVRVDNGLITGSPVLTEFGVANLVVHPDGDVTTVWHSETPTAGFRRVRIDHATDTLSATQVSTNSGSSSFVYDESTAGDGLAVFSQSGSLRVIPFSSSTGWGTEEIVRPSGVSSFLPTIDVTPAGQAVLVWANSGSPRTYSMTHDNLGTPAREWDTTTAVSLSDGVGVNMLMLDLEVVDAPGNSCFGAVAYTETASGNRDLRLKEISSCPLVVGSPSSFTVAGTSLIGARVDVDTDGDWVVAAYSGSGNSETGTYAVDAWSSFGDVANVSSAGRKTVKSVDLTDGATNAAAVVYEHQTSSSGGNLVALRRSGASNFSTGTVAAVSQGVSYMNNAGQGAAMIGSPLPAVVASMIVYDGDENSLWLKQSNGNVANVVSSAQIGAYGNPPGSMASDGSTALLVMFTPGAPVSGNHRNDVTYMRRTSSGWTAAANVVEGVVMGDQTISTVSDGAGRYLVAWSGDSDVGWARLDGATWTSGSLSVASPRGVELVIGSTGATRLFYVDDADDLVKFRTWTGSAWSSATTVTATTAMSVVRVEAGASGSTFVVWADLTNRIKVSRVAGDGTVTESALSAPGYVVDVATSGSTGVVVYVDSSDPTRLSMVRWNGTMWAAPSVLVTESNNVVSTDATFDSTGNLEIVWGVASVGVRTGRVGVDGSVTTLQTLVSDPAPEALLLADDTGERLLVWSEYGCDCFRVASGRSGSMGAAVELPRGAPILENDSGFLKHARVGNEWVLAWQDRLAAVVSTSTSALSMYVPLASPKRIMDTRSSGGRFGTTSSAGSVRRLQVAGALAIDGS
ncbi:MAG: hypothetical protein RLZ19_1095, partial [Actinomycetota bacterium]